MFKINKRKKYRRSKLPAKLLIVRGWLHAVATEKTCSSHACVLCKLHEEDRESFMNELRGRHGSYCTGAERGRQSKYCTVQYENMSD